MIISTISSSSSFLSTFFPLLFPFPFYFIPLLFILFFLSSVVGWENTYEALNLTPLYFFPIFFSGTMTHTLSGVC